MVGRLVTAGREGPGTRAERMGVVRWPSGVGIQEGGGYTLPSSEQGPVDQGIGLAPRGQDVGAPNLLLGGGELKTTPRSVPCSEGDLESCGSDSKGPRGPQRRKRGRVGSRPPLTDHSFKMRVDLGGKGCKTGSGKVAL